MKKALSITLVFLFVASATFAQVRKGKPAPAGSWQVIGTTQANYTRDYDEVRVVGAFDNFRKIKFKVTNSGINIQRIQVVYDNGAPDEIKIRANIRKGGESRAIDLRGVGKRSIRKIKFWYDTKGLLKGKANVTILGQK